MKLDPVFTVKENKLYKIADNSPVNPDDLQKIELLWSKIELEDELYNEDFLAELREQLKSMEPAGKYAILVPVVDKPLETAEQSELFINACNHAARRVKDCTSVAGYELPKQLENLNKINEFIEVLAKKHAQYVYFSHSKDIQNTSIVVY